MVLDVKRFYLMEVVGDLPKFKMNYFLSVIVNSKGQICPGVGSDNEAIELSLSFGHRFMDCYKKLIEDLCNLNKSWTTFEAKYFDKCTMGKMAKIDLHTWKWLDAEQDKMDAGTTYPVSAVYCHAIPGIGKEGEYMYSPVVQNAYAAIGNYMWNTYGPGKD